MRPITRFNVAQLITEARLKSGLTIRQLETELHVRPGTIKSVECGTADITTPTLPKIRDVLKLSNQDIIDAHVEDYKVTLRFYLNGKEDKRSTVSFEDWIDEGGK